MTIINLPCLFINTNTKEKQECEIKVFANSFISLCVGIAVINEHNKENDRQILINKEYMNKLKKLEDFGFFNICLN